MTNLGLDVTPCRYDLLDWLENSGEVEQLPNVLDSHRGDDGSSPQFAIYNDLRQSEFLSIATHASLSITAISGLQRRHRRRVKRTASLRSGQHQEQEHVDLLETQLPLIEKMGLEKNLRSQTG